jgi:hypothetical protein
MVQNLSGGVAQNMYGSFHLSQDVSKYNMNQEENTFIGLTLILDEGRKEDHTHVTVVGYF